MPFEIKSAERKCSDHGLAGYFEALVCPYQLAFHVVHIRAVDYLHATWRGVITCEVPIAEVPRTRFMKVFDCLEHNLDICLHSGRLYDLGDLTTKLFVRKLFVK